MNDITIRRTHDRTPAEARAAAERIATRLQEKFALETAWDGGQLRFKRPGVAGELTLAGQEALLTVRLGAFFSALKPTIEREIAKFLDEHFAA